MTEQSKVKVANFPWLQTAWQTWQQRLEQGGIAQAILYQAPQGSYIDVLMEQLAVALLCKNAQGEPCGFCHSCELAQNGNHPDLHWVMPEQTKAITVEQIRRINQVALESSQLGGRRVILVSPAEAMNEAAANALLKTLETPPEQCIFILLTEDKNRLLPTIVSRCQQWQLPKVDAKQLSAWLLEQLSADKNAVFAQKKLLYWPVFILYPDAPAKALQFIEQDRHLEFAQLLQCLTQSLSGQCVISDIQTLFKEEAIEKIDWLLMILSLVQKAHFNLEMGVAKTMIAPMVENIGYQQAYRQYQDLLQLRHQLIHFTGLNTELLMVDWFLQFSTNQHLR